MSRSKPETPGAKHDRGGRDGARRSKTARKPHLQTRPAACQAATQRCAQQLLLVSWRLIFILHRAAPLVHYKFFSDSIARVTRSLDCSQAPRQGQPLPPVNLASPLLAVHCGTQPSASTSTAATTASESSFGGFTFDTFALQHALTRSQQQTGSGGGLRRATSAPHSMDLLGMEPSAGQQQQRAGYLPPTGGPMRRVASSLGMRRSSSFFWTPAAHHDFERAIDSLSARGAEVSAAAIMAEMNCSQLTELKLADVDKHLRKKALVQRRVLQQLSDRPTHAPSLSLSGAPQSPTSPPARRAGMSVPGAIAEEPTPAIKAGEAAAAAAALSEGLSQQFQAQLMQHRQFAAAREALVAGAEGQAAAPDFIMPPTLS